MVPYVGGGASAAAGADLEACKSSELRAGVFYSECRCLKRDGLQRACRRAGCSDRCGLTRPAQREPVPLGTPVAGLAMQPVCCPGRRERERLEVRPTGTWKNLCTPSKKNLKNYNKKSAFKSSKK